MQKGVSCVCFYCLALLFCLFSLVLFFYVCKKPQKGYYLEILEFIFYIVPPKGLFFISSYSIFFLVFLLFSLSKFHTVFVLCPSTRLYIYIYLFIYMFLEFFLFSVICLLPFPLVMFACLFETYFPNILLLKPKLLSLLVVFCLFSCFCFCFHGVCFCLFFWFVILLFLFGFCCVSCFTFRQWKKHRFPCNSSVF